MVDKMLLIKKTDALISLYALSDHEELNSTATVHKS